MSGFQTLGKSKDSKNYLTTHHTPFSFVHGGLHLGIELQVPQLETL